MQSKERYHAAIDWMRIIAILAVVVIHATTRILEASSFNIQVYTVTFFLNQTSRFAVPLFFMISGFVLEVNYPFHQSYLSYLKKRLSRLFLPYLLWSFIYYYFVYTQHDLSFLQALLTGSASYQLYFIPTLLIFYLVFPFIHKLYHFIGNWRILIPLGIIQVILLAENYYLGPFSLFYPITIAILNYYVFILGMAAACHHALLVQFTNKWKIVLFFLLALCALFIFAEGKLLYMKTHNYLYFYSQWRPSVLLYTTTIFAVLYMIFKKSAITKLADTFSRLSFFVFFIHVIVLEGLWHIFGRNLFSMTAKYPGQQFWFDLLFFFSIATFSYAIAYLVHKLPLLSKIAG